MSLGIILWMSTVPPVTGANEAEIKSWSVCRGFGGQDFTG